VKSKGPDWWVKIGDFGISTRAEEGLTALRTLIGTPGFLAPEVLSRAFLYDDSDLGNSEGYTAAVDIWSLGAIAFHALTGKLAFSNGSLQAYLKGTWSLPIDVLHAHGVSSEGCDLLKSLMAPISKDRLTAKEALGHKWMELPNPYSARSSAEIQRYLFLTTA
jgi:serine/threonine protein kinase